MRHVSHLPSAWMNRSVFHAEGDDTNPAGRSARMLLPATDEDWRLADLGTRPPGAGCSGLTLASRRGDFICMDG